MGSSVSILGIHVNQKMRGKRRPRHWTERLSIANLPAPQFNHNPAGWDIRWEGEYSGSFEYFLIVLLCYWWRARSNPESVKHTRCHSGSWNHNKDDTMSPPRMPLCRHLGKWAPPSVVLYIGSPAFLVGRLLLSVSLLHIILKHKVTGLPCTPSQQPGGYFWAWTSPKLPNERILS